MRNESCAKPRDIASNPELSTLAPYKDPVNVDQPGWKSSQVIQGSGVFGERGAKSWDTIANPKESRPWTVGMGRGDKPMVVAGSSKEKDITEQNLPEFEGRRWKHK